MKLIPNKVTFGVARSILKLKKNSPHIFFAGGVIGAVGSTVLACRATLKLEPVVDDIRNDLEIVKELKEKGVSASGREYSDKDYMHDLRYAYLKSAKNIGKLYGPSVVLGAASIGALTGSHVQMTRRNSALTATVAAVSKAYDDYRNRVREELGEERELDIYHAARMEEVDAEGKKVQEKVVDPSRWSPYARIFDETTPNWTKDAELNRLFLHAQQQHANHRLNARGHVFLNEIYDDLGFERTQAGSVVGWLKNSDGDGFISFGIFEAHANRFVNGIERSIILDFNVDGIIYDKI